MNQTWTQWVPLTWRIISFNSNNQIPLESKTSTFATRACVHYKCLYPTVYIWPQQSSLVQSTLLFGIYPTFHSLFHVPTQVPISSSTFLYCILCICLAFHSSLSIPTQVVIPQFLYPKFGTVPINPKSPNQPFHCQMTVLFIQRRPFQQIDPHVHIHFAYFSSNATNGG